MPRSEFAANLSLVPSARPAWQRPGRGHRARPASVIGWLFVVNVAGLCAIVQIVFAS